MSNPLEIVKRMYAAFGRGDIAGVMAHIADDVEWIAEGPEEMVFTGIRHGKKEVLDGFFGGIAREHADPVLEMTEFVAQGDAVASFGRYTVTLKRSGNRVSSPVGHLFKVRGGKVIHYTNMLNTAAFMGQPATSGIVVVFAAEKLEAAQYDEVLRRLAAKGALPPAGGKFHVCYGEPGKLRVLDVFDSLESFQNFAQILMPIIHAVGIEAAQPEILPVHGSNWQ